MSQDIVSDALNLIMNAKRAGKNSVSIARHSKLLLSVLAIGKLKGYIKDYRTEGNTLVVDIGSMNFCMAVKPRYLVRSDQIDKYVRRYLPGRGIGIVVISTNKGLMTHQTANDKKLGGSIIAYFY